MYKDKEKAKAAGRERVRRYRERQKGVTSGGVTPEGVTRIAERLTDPVWRPRLGLICESLGNLSSEVYLDGVPMDMWAELLSVTA